MNEERFIVKRMSKLILLLVSSIIYTILLGFRTGLAIDEAFAIIFLELIFLAMFTYLLEEQRLGDKLPLKEANDFYKIAIIWSLGLLSNYICSYLPVFVTLSFVFAIAMTAVSNREIALISCMFMDLIFVLGMRQDVLVFSSRILLAIMGVILFHAYLKEKQQLWVQFIAFFGTIVIINANYYIQNLVLEKKTILLSVIIGGLNLASLFSIRFLLKPVTEEEIVGKEAFYKILEPNYPLVQAIKKFSDMDYMHAIRVSDICDACANYLGLDRAICKSAGFYYRIGRMEGEPYIQNGVTLAENFCFPNDLIQVLREYNGELQPISTKESAIVHMVDHIVTKLDLLDKDTFSSNWNQDMVIYQTLNEDSATGIYDESGLGMNQFLKIRDFLVKGDQLF